MQPPPQGQYPPPPQGQYPPPPPQQIAPAQGQVPPAGTTVVVHYWYHVPEDKQAAKKYAGTRKWENVMICICFREPAYCCYGMCCTCCAICTQRMRLLHEDIDNYVCCGGLFPVYCETLPCCSGKCGLCLEAFYCPFCAIQGNRYMIRQHYNLEFDKTEAYMYALIVCLECSAACCKCICRCLCCGNTCCGECCSCCADTLYCIILGCLLAQNHNQMETLGYPWPDYQAQMK